MHHLSKQLKGLRSAASPKWEQLAERKGNGDVDTVGADVYYDATELLVLFKRPINEDMTFILNKP